jgi:cbb3-type cytochrome oxidase subunit 3
MSYETLQVVSQLAAMAIFGSVMAAVIFYTFTPANRAKFEHASRLPLEQDIKNEDEGR